MPSLNARSDYQWGGLLVPYTTQGIVTGSGVSRAWDFVARFSPAAGYPAAIPIRQQGDVQHGVSQVPT